MSHHQSAAELIIGLVLMGGLGLMTWAITSQAHDRLSDPTDDRTLFLDQLASKCQLAPHGSYRVTVFRQSGNVHAETVMTGSASEALQVALSTFRRAKINAVNVGANTRQLLRFGRMYHDHRGRAEGKKVGSATIEVLWEAEAATPAPLPVPNISTFLEVICDCGGKQAVPLNLLEAPIVCAACGKEDRLTLAQIMQAKSAANVAEKEALERRARGETDIIIQRRLGDPKHHKT